MARFVELMITFTIVGFSYFDHISVKYDIVINSSSSLHHRVPSELSYHCNRIFLDFEVSEYIRDIDRDSCEEMCLDNADCVAVEYRNSSSTTVCTLREKNANGFKIVNIKNSQIIVFLSKLATGKVSLSLNPARLKGNAFWSYYTSTERRCISECKERAECDGYWHNRGRCHLMSVQDMTGIEFASYEYAGFLPRF